MKLYTVHIKPEDLDKLENTVFIPESFSFFAFFFHIFWLLGHRLWFYSIVIFACEASIILLRLGDFIPAAITPAFNLGLMLYIGFSFHDWQRDKLKRKGFIFADVVTGNNFIEARRRFFDLHFKSLHRLPSYSPIEKGEAS